MTKENYSPEELHRLRHNAAREAAQQGKRVVITRPGTKEPYGNCGKCATTVWEEGRPKANPHRECFVRGEDRHNCSCIADGNPNGNLCHFMYAGTTNLDVIDKWFGLYDDCNWGTHTLGQFILDFDVLKDDDGKTVTDEDGQPVLPGLDLYFEEHGEDALDGALIRRSPSGGLHAEYRMDPTLSVYRGSTAFGYYLFGRKGSDASALKTDVKAGAGSFAVGDYSEHRGRLYLPVNDVTPVSYPYVDRFERKPRELNMSKAEPTPLDQLGDKAWYIESEIKRLEDEIRSVGDSGWYLTCRNAVADIGKIVDQCELDHDEMLARLVPLVWESGTDESARDSIEKVESSVENWLEYGEDQGMSEYETEWLQLEPHELPKDENGGIVKPSEEDRLRKLVDEFKFNLRAKQLAAQEFAAENRLDLAPEDPKEVLARVLRGEVTSAPSFGDVADDPNCGLFYPRTINGMFGDQGTGKTWLLANLWANVLNNGGIVVHWEFDNNSTEDIYIRLLTVGADPEQIADNFIILRSPEEADELTSDVIRATELVTLDALTPAITVGLGDDPNTSAGVDRALGTYLAPFTVHGACGIFIAHPGHENKDRMAGSIRGSQALQGVLYQVKMQKRLERGKNGCAQLVLRKDNKGKAGKADAIVGYVNYKSTGDFTDGGSVTVQVTRKIGVIHFGDVETVDVNAMQKGEDYIKFLNDTVVTALKTLGSADVQTIQDFAAGEGVKNFGKGRASKAIERLIESGKVEEFQEQTPGRPATKYRLVGQGEE